MARWTMGFAGSVLLCSLVLLSHRVLAQQAPEQQALRLQQEAKQLEVAGQIPQAIEVAKRALALQEAAFGPQHPEVAAFAATLGDLYSAGGNYDAAAAAYARVVALRETSVGADHPDLAKALSDMAGAQVRIGNYSKAEPLYQRALAICEKALGNEHFETSRALVGLGDVYQGRADYETAAAFFERALGIRERIQGERHPSLVTVLSRLAGAYLNVGDYARAEPLFRRSLSIGEAQYGADALQIAPPLANLGILYSAVGSYVQAEESFKRALAIQEQKTSAEHPRVALILNTLANMYAKIGAFGEAEPLLRRAIAIQEKLGASAREDLALSFNNLADLYSEMGDYAQAQVLAQRAATMLEQVLGPEHPYLGMALGNLGNVYGRMGAFDRAEPLLSRSLAIVQSASGPNSRGTGVGHYGLAELYLRRGDYAKAQPSYERALGIFSEALGTEHPETVDAMGRLAQVQWARGQVSQALALLQKVQRIRSRNADRLLLAGSEARKSDYQKRLTDAAFRDVSFSVAHPSRAAATLGFTSVLNYKGRVLDALSDNIARIRRSIQPGDQSVLAQLEQVAGQLSTLTYGGGPNLTAERYVKQLAELTARHEQMQARLALRSQSFKRLITPATVPNVAAAIPPKAVLVEWLRYTPIAPGVAKTPPAPRYVAYVLERGGTPVTVDLGPASAIEMATTRLLAALGTSDSSDVREHAATLSTLVLAPLRAQLRDVEHILFAPDGALNLVPAGVLLDEAGRYLVERHDVSYLTSGRDLLRQTSQRRSSGNILVVADPDYGRTSGAPARDTSVVQARRSAELDRGGLTFRPLAGAALEAQALRDLLKLGDSNVLLRAEASEFNLKRQRAPRILHIATHGFFLSDLQLQNDLDRRLTSGSAPLAVSENPLLRSGIALAGANERSSGDSEDGILTALEASQLDLDGTELVVLSACDAGRGEVLNGEGVYGLRRALALAGAQTQITSLWKVSDLATRQLMLDYYQGLLRGQGRSAALRSVQRAMLASTAFAHPYYWASFVAIGDWTALPSLLEGRTAAP